MNERDRDDDDFSDYTLELDFDGDDEILSEEELELIKSRIDEHMQLVANCEHEFEDQYAADLGEIAVCHKCGLIELKGMSH